MDDSIISKVLGVPRQVLPIEIPSALPQNPNPYQPPYDPLQGTAESFVGTCSSAHPYVMRSKKFGSVDPDDDTAPLGLDVANEDTWERDNPPQLNAVAVSSISVANPTVITTAAHGITVGEIVRVIISGTTSTPSINGTYFATSLSGTTVSIPVNVTVSPGTSGTMAIGTSGVTIGPEQRHYIYNSGSGTYEYKVFAREKKWDACGELYYIGPEVEIENATIAGSGSASGGLP